MQFQKFISPLFVFIVFTTISLAKADVVLYVSPNSQSVALGSTTTAEVAISGLGGFTAPALGAFDFIVSFDPSILELTGVSFGDPVLGDLLDLSGLGSIQVATPSTGSDELFELSLDSITDLESLQPASFVLGTIDFDTVGSGVSPLNLTINALSDAIGDPLFADTQNGSIEIDATSLPEPRLSSFIAILIAGCFGKYCSFFGRRSC